MLALLLLRANQAVAAGWLVEELWSGRPPRSAYSTLRTYVSRLRRELDRFTRSAVLLSRPPGYLLEVDPDAIDAVRFERMTVAGRAALAGDQPGAAVRQLRTALGLWRGPVLADLADLTAATAERTRLAELRLAALEARIDADLALGQSPELAAELEVLIAEHPLRERLHAQLMLTLYRSGRQAEALAAFHQARKLLTDGLGIEPGSALRQLHQAILRQEQALDPVPERSRRAGSAGSAVRPSDEPFVGRATEMAQLRASLDDARAGHGRLMMLSGEPGIGKTRIARELAEHARATGVDVLWGRAWEEDGAPVFWPWVRALRGWMERLDPAIVNEAGGADAALLAQLVPGIADRFPGLPAPAHPDSAAARFQLFDAVTRVLRHAAGKRPMLLVLDDMHRADVPSLRLTQFLTRELGNANLLILATFRDVAEGRDPAFLGVLSELSRESSARSLRLRGLRHAETARYVELAAGFEVVASVVAELHARTGGNPFFLRELVRLLADQGELAGARQLNDDVPPGVLAAVMRRLDSLPNQAPAILAEASVVGRVFSLEVLQAAHELTEELLLDVLERATAAGLITEIPGFPGRYRFAHVLIRDALYGTLSGIRRARLHRTVGEAIEMIYHCDIEDHLAELGHHFRVSGSRPKAASYAARAGARARSLYAYEEAARQFELALHDEDEPERRRELLLAATEARRLAGDWGSWAAT